MKNLQVNLTFAKLDLKIIFAIANQATILKNVDPAMFNFRLLNAGFISFGTSDRIITVWDFKSEG